MNAAPPPPRPPAAPIRAGLAAALLAGLLRLPAAACPDAGQAGFLRGLNRDREYALTVYQGTLDRLRDTACRDPQRDLELAKALYHLGAFPRVRAVLGPHLREPDARFRHYYFEAWMLDRGEAGGPDSARATAEALGLPAAERGEIAAASAFLAGDAPGARAAWPVPLGAPCAEGEEEARCLLEKGFKSPGAAAWLSLAPGAGYAYAGRRGDGLFAFSAISACYGLAAAYAALGSPGRAWALGAMGAVLHGSSAYGGARAAREANRQRKLAFVLALHRRWFP